MSELALRLIAENKRTRATFLDLGNCGLTEVPDEIGDLVWLKDLSFSGNLWEDQDTATINNIVRLSSRFERLKLLKRLVINGLFDKKHDLTDLSPLASLSGLQQLQVNSTQVADLSPLAGLSGLQQLYVSDTQIVDLIPLANLSGLQWLSVASTPVADLSPLANLNHLQKLNVRGTQINDLSPLLLLIEKNITVKWNTESLEGNGIYVGNCPLTNPPIAIVQQGNAAILNYFNEKQSQGIDHIYEAKLLLVGEGGAGKTSLLRRLYQPEQLLPDEKETTKGIAIHRHEFNVLDNRYPNGRDFRLNVWDFGGQEIYHATHQFFLTQRSLYVLLDDTRKDHKTVHDEGFKYWLEAVDLLSDHSPLLIFQNEKGGRSKQIDETGIKGKFNNVKGCYQGNLEHQNSAESLRKAIEHFAQSLPHIGEELPARWLDIRADIEQLAQQQATISQQAYFDLYQKHLPYDRIKALHLSRYLHDLGVFLHFQDDSLLARTVILQNHWATEAVFKVLDDETVKSKLGRFTAEDCKRLWQNSKYADMHPELLALMQKFELCYRLPDVKHETWLAPQLLPPSKPIELKDWPKPGDLVLHFRYEFLPKGLVSRLMVRQHYLVARPKLGWLTGVLFESDETQLLVEIALKGDEIVLRARGLERKELLSIIAADLDALNNTFDGLAEKVTKLIPCHCEQCRTKTEPEFFEQKRLLQRKKDAKLTIECPASYEDVQVLALLDSIHAHKVLSRNQTKIPKKIFISYSKHDNDHKNTLIKHLAGLRNNMVTWNDRDLLASEDWDDRIKQELHQADMVLYLVSHHSMATDYIQNVELPLIETRCNDGECKLIPIIVDFCLWEDLDFAKYNALPEKGEPITNSKHWVNENQAWLEVIKGIKRLLN